MERLIALHRRLVTVGPQGQVQQLFFGILIAIGWLYGLFGWMRAALYRSGMVPVYRASVPVISVGNLTAGGTGKTPMVDLIVKMMLDRGRRVAVVSRGYGGRGCGKVGVVSASQGALLNPDICGDEPFLLAQRNPEAVVIISPRRADGIRSAVERFGADVVVLDDGFQHLAVARDLDIVLLDARRPFGNGHLLPAGVLRESPSALKRAGFIVLTRGEESETPDLPVAVPIIRCRHKLSDEAVSFQGERVPLERLAELRGVAFAGIADPENFFTSLSGKGLRFKSFPLPDHVSYDSSTLELLSAAGQDANFLVTTEKDGVKLGAASFPIPCYKIPMTLEFYDEGSLLLERALEAVTQPEKT